MDGIKRILREALALLKGQYDVRSSDFDEDQVFVSVEGEGFIIQIHKL